MSDNKIVFGFSGFSGSGKTTLIEKIVPIIKDKGFSVVVIKHDAHDFEIDKEGKDTWRFEKAGADHVYISSSIKSARVSNCSRTMEEMLEECRDTDIVLIEGYKYADIPRIGITCEGMDFELPGDTDVYRAIVTDRTDYFSEKVTVPVFDRDDAEGLAGWILGYESGSEPDTGRDEPGGAVFGSDGLTHFDDEGNARMVTVADKSVTRRTATAGARVLVNPETFALIKNGSIKKGDVLTVAQVAGIMGAKRTPDLIPMCHPI
ncbi:MAG: molybdopterin-guanine dinucleotide biosynthesis protein B, partial [Eubacterium sp.]|nr:molybdopterin-guanine dinucleotide biosynthesis protein B [Eubacterium sp.]